MVPPPKKSRIVFLDLMRAFAVIMMVQGHTVDALLAQEYRDMSNPLFVVWLFMRGMTAPTFLFTAGTVFTYLFSLNKLPFDENPRVKKGIKRFFYLLLVGYLLRYPTWKLVDFSDVSSIQWITFFTTDVLHMTAFGVLFAIGLKWLAEKTKISDYKVFGAATILFIGLHLQFEFINWKNYLPDFLIGYFYTGRVFSFKPEVSLFPLFPWLAYMFAGGILGTYLARHPRIFTRQYFPMYLSSIGLALIILSYLLSFFNDHWNHYSIPQVLMLAEIVLRLGFVLFLSSLFSIISMSVENIPQILILIGRNTLLIYVAHLLIVYGGAWNPGLTRFLGDWNLAPLPTVTIAIANVLVMIGLVYLVYWFKLRNKTLVA